MSKTGRSSADSTLTSGDSFDVASLPPNDALHDEYNSTVAVPRSTADSRQGTTGDTTLPNTADVTPKGPDLGPVEPQTPPKFYVNPTFESVETESLHAIVRTVPWTSLKPAEQQIISDGFKEVIARYDNMLNPTDAKTAVGSIGQLQNGLEANKRVKVDDNNNVVLSDDELTGDGRWDYHKAVAGDLTMMNDQVEVRQTYARFLRTIGKTAESENMSREAIELSERMPASLVQRQAKSAEEFGTTLDGTAQGKELTKYVKFLTDPENGFDKLPLATRKDALANSLGLRIDNTRNFMGIKQNSLDLTFGTDRQFNPDRAFELATELRQKTIELTGRDPLTTGDRTNGAFFPPTTNLSAVDFGKTNVYAMAEQLSGRRFEGTGKISSEEFAKISEAMFDKIDSNGDQSLDSDELKAATKDTTLTNEQRQAVETLNETQALLQGLDTTDGGKGVSRKDLLAFAREQRESTERLEKIKEARARLLFNNDFEAVDDNVNKYLTQKELKNFLNVKGSTLSESEMKSFNFLNDSLPKLSTSWWGMTRSDLADPRSENVRRVEASLWKSYYNTRTVSDK